MLTLWHYLIMICLDSTSKTGDKSERGCNPIINLNFSHDGKWTMQSLIYRRTEEKLLLPHLVLEGPQLLILDEPTNLLPPHSPSSTALWGDWWGNSYSITWCQLHSDKSAQIYRLDSNGFEKLRFKISNLSFSEKSQKKPFINEKTQA